jgi:hypothetical protein
MSGRFEETLTDDELAAQAAEPLPDREVMSVICPPDDPGIVAGDWTGGDAETAPEESSEPIPPGPGPTAHGDAADPYPAEEQ